MLKEHASILDFFLEELVFWSSSSIVFLFPEYIFNFSEFQLFSSNTTSK